MDFMSYEPQLALLCQDQTGTYSKTYTRIPDSFHLYSNLYVGMRPIGIFKKSLRLSGEASVILIYP
jgi:hypothetical protein